MVTQINTRAKEILSHIISMMNDGYVKLGSDNDIFMPLVVERIGEPQNSVFGAGTFISLCHYYVQYGDMMQDPEVVFYIIDEREHPKDFGNFLVYPSMFQQANVGIYQELLIFRDGKTLIAQKKQRECAEFCNAWLDNIRHQQSAYF